MIKMVFNFLLLVLTVSGFGQQALWSTVGNNDIKYIPYNNVTKEVLEFYDLYKFYFDFTGFNKDELKKIAIEKYNHDEKDWNWINDIEERAVFAFRTPIEGGSAIILWCIDKNNFHMVIFSNVYDSGANMTYNGEMRSDRERFEKWFKTLLNVDSLSTQKTFFDHSDSVSNSRIKSGRPIYTDPSDLFINNK